MRKPTKSSMTRKLDKVCSDITRAKGKCAKCSCADYSKLQTSHTFSRTYRSVRWDLDNLIPLCASCHFWVHRNPVLFTEWLKDYLGEYKYNTLKTKANMLKKWTLDEMVQLYHSLVQLSLGEK